MLMQGYWFPYEYDSRTPTKNNVRICLCLQQSTCSYTQSGCGVTMSGNVQIKSCSESDLQSAIANIGPISVAVDASSSGFRVSLLNQYHLLALYYYKRYYCIFFLTVLLFWSVQLHKMLQHYPNPCHGCYWIWHLWWR